jgi:hypothetical protein
MFHIRWGFPQICLDREMEADRLFSFPMNSPAILVCSLSIGLLVGWMSAPEEDSPSPSASAEPRSPLTPSRAWDPGKFIEDATEKAAQLDRSDDAKRLLASLTDEEIAGALNEAVMAPDFLVRELGVTSSLFQEFLRRDFDAGFGWFSNLPDEKRGKLAKAMATGWPEERLREGIDYLVRTRPPSDSRGNGWSPLIAKALKSTSGQGAKAFAILLADLQRAGFQWQLPYTFDLEPGFDFASLLESPAFDAPSSTSSREKVMDAWARSDRDAAFSWILEHRGVEDLTAFMGHDPNRPASAQTELREWLGGRLDEMHPDERSTFIRKWTEGLATGSEREVSALLGGMKDPAGRTEVFNRFSQRIYSGGVDAVIRLVDRIPDKGEALDLLEKIQPDAAEIARKGRKPMTPDEQARLRAKLLALKADESRADAIIQRFQSE